MNGYTSKYAQAKCRINGKSCSYTEPIKECVYKYSYPRNKDDMIEMLMRVFVGMVMVYMIMRMCSEDFFEEIYHQKTKDKSIDSVVALFERLWQYMDERYRKHRSCSESDEEVEDFLVDTSKKI